MLLYVVIFYYSSTPIHYTACVGRKIVLLGISFSDLHRSAFIKHKLGNLPAAIIEYTTVLEMDKNYFAALKGPYIDLCNGIMSFV